MLINKNLIKLDLKSKNKKEAIEELAELAKRDCKIDSFEDYVESVLKREESYSTGIGNGIAIPHGKSNSVKEALIVFGRCEGKIEWDSLDGKPVNLVFLLGIPEENAGDIHLKVLSQLSRKIMHDDFVQLLRNSKTEDEVLGILEDLNFN
jgi:PTS system fructose-specific IIA component